MFDLSFIDTLRGYYLLFSNHAKNVSELSEHKQRIMKQRMNNRLTKKVDNHYELTIFMIYIYQWFDYFNIPLKVSDEHSVWLN